LGDEGFPLLMIMWWLVSSSV